MLHAGILASTVAAWHGHDVRMTTAVSNRVYDEGLRLRRRRCSGRRGDRLVIADVLVDVAGLSALASLLSLRYPIVLVADVSASTFPSRSFRGQALLADGPGGKQFQSVGSGGGWRCGVDVQLQPGLRGQFHGLEVEVQLADHRVS